ncbi:MAG: glycosyltransferase [Polyangiaceae bacterium]|nr:glycosyltransferase [Polyangiaceae bacterium]
MRIAFFGSSLVSSYWNGAATYYRGLIRALHARGHRVTFYEPDAYDRQAHRDLPDVPWARVVVYPGDDEGAALRCVEEARAADVLVKASGIGVHDALLEAAIPAARRPDALAVLWDVDAPATLDRLRSTPSDPLRALVPRFDLVLTYGGGDPIVRGYTALGARRGVPVYNALDPSTHFRVVPEPRFEADLAFLANRLPDREARVGTFFFEVARGLPGRRFLLGGSGWGDLAMPRNVAWIGHVGTAYHNAFNSTPRAVLNVARDSMAAAGFSPATRVFEAAGAAACLITDAWDGIELFLEPGREVLVARDGGDVIPHLAALSESRARAIGEAARRRVLAHHTYAERARKVEALLMNDLSTHETAAP